ncbi:UNVERIFIED_CONTAM: hypothetical protein GTU68_052984, partial [Idotea baltica]|nr:hypothetical protein [Idotea baltica]
MHPPDSSSTMSFSCDKCSQTFNSETWQKLHSAKHIPFQCNFCPFSTKNLGNFKKHQFVHTQEKPFKCDHCSFSTSKNSSLKIHIRRHTGEK